MTTQTRTIRIVVDTKQAAGLKKLTSQFGRMNKNVQQVSTSLGGLRRIFQTVVAGFGVREVVRSADSFQLLRDRIKVFTGDAESANEVFGDIISLARETRSSIENFAEGYNRVAIATQGLKLSSQQTLGVVAALQQSLRLSGASAQEASSVFIQLSQALSLGRLQGQELRAVLLSNAVVANILAKEFQVTTGQLKELGEQGRLTSDRVIKALAENFEDLNNKAGNLGVTFGQSLTIAIDAFRVKIDELNSTFGLSSAFFKAIDLFIENMETITKVVGTLVATGLFLKLADQVKTFTITVQASIAANGGLIAALKTTRIAAAALLAVFSFVAIEAITNWEKFQLTVRKGALTVLLELRQLEGFFIDFVKSFNVLGDFNPLSGIGDIASALNDVSVGKIAEDLGTVTQELKNLEGASGENGVSNLLDDINKSLNNFDGQAIAGLTGDFGKLNQQLRNNVITLEQYRLAVDAINIAKLNEQVKEGKITWDQYNEALIKVNSSFNDLSAGRQALKGIQLGAEETLRGIGSLAEEIKGVTVNAFGNLEDRLVEFAKTGKFAFADFAQAVVDDLTRVAIRLSVIRALASSVGFGGGGGGDVVASANGNVFSGGKVQPFANGGVVSSPTIFPMANGTGLMGEAGPEAIMPLQRTRDGKLGVAANGGGGNTIVNVINNSKGQVETRESRSSNGEKQIDVIILDRMSKAFREGKMDKVMSTTFGVSRRGT